MKGLKRVLLWLPLSMFVFLGFCNNINESPDQKLLGTILSALEKNHFEPVVLNDAFSKDVYKTYLDRLDGGKRFFLQKDYDKFSKYETKIDDQCKKKDLSFFKLVDDTYSKRIISIEGMIEENLKKPFGFSEKESVEVSGDKLSATKNNKEQKERWRKFLKLAVLEKVARRSTVQKELAAKSDTAVEIFSMDSLEFKARAEVLKTHQDWFKRLKRMKHRDRLTIYINSIANRFDPHTSYFPPKDKENFDIGMSGRLEGIGATLSERDGYIKVERIVPGSASYKQGELKSGDLIMKVGQGKKTPVDVVDMPLDDAVQLIRGKKGTVVSLTVKKLDGSIAVIDIERDVVVIEEGYAKSAIFEKDGKKYGYIYLPQFYADFNRKGGREAASDMKMELQKLKLENVDGIMFDMRNNGGGSLQEAIDIGGLFVKSGPMVQVKESNRSPNTYTDRDGGSVEYDGPLVVLVNSFSASASEIVAAALQDYNRAVVMGTKSTYGKGTVQTFIDFDRGMLNAGRDPMGALKLTIQKFYRINGGSTQLEGVTPDIVFPDRYDSMKLGERDQEHPLPWDKIPAANYLSMGNNFDRVVAQSKLRISNSPKFDLLKEYTQFNHNRSKNTNYSLNFKEYVAKQKEFKENTEKYKDVYKLDSALNANVLIADQKELASDTAKLKIKKNWVKSISKDVYLEEGINVLENMVKP
jgi:carboxyl-terminal processing protease